MKKLFCLFLALITIILAIVSCDTNENKEQPDDTKDVVGTDVGPDTEEETEGPIVIKEYDLSKFKIVYDNLYNMDIAKELKSRFKSVMNLDLPMSKASASNEYEFEIIIGEAERDVSKRCFDFKKGKYLNAKGIYCDNGKVQILGIDRLTIKASVDYFFANIVKKDTNIINIPEKGADMMKITHESISIPERMDGSSIRLVSNNIQQQSLNKSWERVTALMGAFEFYDADIYTLQEVDTLWREDYKLIEKMEQMGYTLVTGKGKVYNCPIFYKTDRFELVDGEYVLYDITGLAEQSDRAYCWACLKDKTTGKKIIVVSTHFIANGKGSSAETVKNRELHREACANQLVEIGNNLQKKYNADGVVMSGDLNCYMSSRPCQILSNGLNSARELCPSKVNMDYWTSCSVGVAPKREEGKAIDHVFYSKTGITPKHFETIISRYSYAYSDHVPVVFDFELN